MHLSVGTAFDFCSPSIFRQPMNLPMSHLPHRADTETPPSLCLKAREPRLTCFLLVSYAGSSDDIVVQTNAYEVYSCRQYYIRACGQVVGLWFSHTSHVFGHQHLFTHYTESPPHMHALISTAPVTGNCTSILMKRATCRFKRPAYICALILLTTSCRYDCELVLHREHGFFAWSTERLQH